MMNLIKKLGSVGFTAVISVVLILLLIVSTSMEAINGTPFAQKVFYQARWFDVLMSLLWINIFCSTVIRFPFKKSQIGFLVTHVGILGLLAGALITRTHGIDGDMTIFEGETQDSLRQSGYSLGVGFPNQEETVFDLQKGSQEFILTKERLNASTPFCPLEQKKLPKTARPIPKPQDTVAFNVTNIIDKAAERRTVTSGNEQGPLNHAVQVKVQSKQLSENISLWLIEHDTNNPSANEAVAGPVSLSLQQQKKASDPQKPMLRVLDKADHVIVAIDLSQKVIAKNIALAKTGLSIKDLEFYPYATVANNKIVNFPEGKKSNPAVVFNFVDEKGVATRKVKFAFFPEFESMHPGDPKKTDSVQIKFEAGKPEDIERTVDGLQISFLYSEGESLQYQTKLKNKVIAEGDVVAGKCLPAGWMDVEFCVQEILSRAHVTYEIASTKDAQGVLAAAVTVPSVSGSEIYWVFEGKATPVHLSKGQVFFFLAPKTMGLPFSLSLKQFRKIDYPGTQDPASYESDVVLTDPLRRVSMERTISMNRPLEYDGYKVFQSSYFTDPQYGKASVFTVAKNPGIPWIYIGSILACIGALFQFYWTKEKKA